MNRAKTTVPRASSGTTETASGRKRSGALTTGDMARLARSTVRTVRFYEEAGVLEPAVRSEGGHRLFEQAELDKLLLVLDLRTAGLSLDEIKALLALKSRADSGATASTRVAAALEGQLVQMRERIAALTRLEDEFATSITALTGCGACEDPTRFPTACSSCPRLLDKLPGPPPRALRVLWQLAGGEPNATAVPVPSTPVDASAAPSGAAPLARSERVYARRGESAGDRKSVV